MKFATILAIALLVPAAARADQPALMTLDDVGRGELLFRTTEPGRYAPAPLVATEVDIKVGGIVARTVVRQHFVNPTESWLEGRYVFPLPENAAVDRMTLTVGDRTIEARIAERAEARRTYEKAKKEGRRAALVEQHRPNIFSNEVANVPPGGRIAVELRYMQTLRYDRGKFSLRFPMVVAPRFDPAANLRRLVRHPFEPQQPKAQDIAVPVRDTTTQAPLNPVALKIEIDAGLPLEKVVSTSHGIDIEKTGEGRRRIALSAEAVPADRDFTLDWTPHLGDRPMVAAFRETVGDDTYALFMIMPPAEKAATTPAPPRDTIFIFDRSGSMAGTSIRAARAALSRALDRLRPQDRFNIIRFSSETDALFRDPQATSPANLARARQLLERTDADGGTVMRPALLHALRRATADSGRLRQVVFLTDGGVSNEMQLFHDIHERLGETRLFTVGIGSAPNGYFMRRAAEAGRGANIFISDLGRVEPEMTALFEKLSRPAMTGIAPAWTDAEGAALLTESFPRKVPDLYFGEPVVLAARLPAAAAADATLRLGAGAWTAALPVAAARPADGIGTVWARAKVAALTDSLYEGAPPDAVKAAITETGLAHGIVTRHTSLVATETTRARPAEADVVHGDVPLNLPHGWDYEKVFGEKLRRKTAAPAAQKAAFGAAQPVPLPRGATPFLIHLAAGVGFLAAGGVTLLLARRRRRI